MYRPTVRYADDYKNYVDRLFHATNLDRNQIIRAALFAAAHSQEFKNIMLQHRKKKDVPLPSPIWSLDDWRFWKYQEIQNIREGKDVNVKHSGKRDYEKNGTTRDPGGRFDRERNGPIQKDSLPGTASRRFGEMASKGSKDIIRGNGGGITIRIN